MRRLKRLSHIQPGETPFTRKTLYKFKYLGRLPGVFIKVGGALFVDLDELDKVIEAGRVK